MYDFGAWIERISMFSQRIDSSYVTTEFETLASVTNHELDEIEKGLRLVIPNELRELWTTSASSCHFEFTCRYRHPATNLWEAHLSCISVVGPLAADDGLDYCEYWGQLVDENGVGSKELWVNSFPFLAVGNGDLVGLVSNETSVPSKVVYLNHEGGGGVVSNSVTEFLDAWTELYFLGPIFSHLKRFIDPKTGSLSSSSSEAIEYRRIMACFFGEI